MKNMESVAIARIIERDDIANILGRARTETEFRVVCHGNSTYRVWEGDFPVHRLFPTFESAEAYAVDTARHNPAVMVGLASLQML